MMRPAFPKSGPGLRVTAKLFFITAAALMLASECAAGSGPAAPAGFAGVFREPVFENFRIEGQDFSVSAERLKLILGEKAHEGPLLKGAKASGFELRFNRPPGEIAARGLIPPYSSMPGIEIADGAVFFEAAPSFFAEKGISFKNLKLTPGEDSFLLEAEDFCPGEFRISSLRADIRAEGDSLVFPSVSGEFAGGEFLLEGKAGTGKGGLSVSGYINDLLIERVPGTPDGDMSGRAELCFELSGDPGRPHSLSGSATARLSDGDIRRVPVLRGLAPTFLGASYGDAVFSGGEASFVLEDGVCSLQNARLLSEEASIGAAGSIMLDGKLDIIVEAFFTEEYMRQRSGPASVFAHILKICDYFIIRHRVTGTLAEPYYEPMPIPAVTMLPLHAGRILGFLLPMRSGETP